ncbi:GNAT family N-acetyltransferase [Sutcliffiella horikoshii]|uniref:GNAT family N-acetyltransferase n=1 Tax=Sutcliffiella horikoshii TaxID=79883 RepID=A0ABN4ZDU7_9BACI|nr:GNAT family N-acetyltransferase [Sutcliffiella horikoshii]ART76493.1 GNAT family N-acetyltransferase [Sutcliffiella horikoshii]
MIYQKEELLIRKLQQGEDEKHLLKWLSEPKVLEFYEGRDITFNFEDIKRKFFNRNDEIFRCMVIYQGKSIGYIQYYPINKATSTLAEYFEMEGVYGLDQFIGDSDYWNKGIGTLLISSMVNYLLTQRGVNRLVMDPMISNGRGIKCYKKCGFKKIKVLGEHILHEGKYRDCWLMEYTT